MNIDASTTECVESFNYDALINIKQKPLIVSPFYFPLLFVISSTATIRIVDGYDSMFILSLRYT